MKVTVNDTEISIFSGAKVIDAVRQYYATQEQAMPSTPLTIKDACGYTVAEDGALSENSRLFIVEQNNSKKKR